MGSWCGSSPSSTTSTTTSIDPAIKDQFLGTAGIANSLANRGPDALPQMPNLAPMTDQQNAAGAGIWGTEGAANAGLGQAVNDYSTGSMGLAQGAGYQPQQVTGSTVAATPNVTAGNFLGANVGSYMSPFLQGVANPALQELNRQNQIALSNVGSQAETEGAYGGARQGLAEGETNRGYANTAASLLGNLFNTGFTNAQNQINLDQNRALSADQGNQNFGFQTNALNAQLAQQANLANQNAGLTANQQGIGANSALIGAGNAGLNNALSANSALYGIGQQQQQLNQGNLNNQFQNAQALYNQPINNLNLRLAAQGQNPLAYGSTVTQPVYSNGLGTAAGLGIAGAGVANTLFNSTNGLFG